MALYSYLNESYELKQEEKSAFHNKYVFFIRFQNQKITKASFTVKNLRRQLQKVINQQQISGKRSLTELFKVFSRVFIS